MKTGFDTYVFEYYLQREREYPEHSGPVGQFAGHCQLAAVDEDRRLNHPERSLQGERTCFLLVLG